MAGTKFMLQVGLVSIATTAEPAVDKESSDFKAVCLGTEENPHAASRVNTRMTCPICEIYHSSTHGFPHRAVERLDGLRVLTSEEIDEAKGTPRTGREKPIELAFHPREKVMGATVVGDSVQNIYPQKGAEKAYVALRETLALHPDLVACMIWAPSSANALWTLDVLDNRILATKRAWPEAVRAPQAIPEVEVTADEIDFFSQLVDLNTSDFDLSVYSDQAKLKLKALADGGSASPEAVVSRAQTDDLLASLQRSVETAMAARKPAKKTAAKKAPAKKAAPARKTAAKKTTTRKKVAAA